MFNEDFVRRLKENDFIFEDISEQDGGSRLTTKEIAAMYLATELMVPFDRGITSELLEDVAKSALLSYIDWFEVWDQYAAAGFTLAGKYIIHIK